MQGIIHAFETILYIIKTMGNIIVNIFIHIGDILTFTNKATITSMDMIDTFPPIIQYFAVGTFLVTLIYLLVGRQGGKSDK